MKAKTTKFFAMLAVLAVAFAGCVILFSEQNDAAGAAGVTKDTYPEDGVIASIELEDTADVKSVVLYTDSTEIKPTYAYFFDEDADVVISDKVTMNKPVMFFVLNGKTINVVAPVEKFSDIGLIEFVNVKSYDEDSGIITLYSDITFDGNGYAKKLENSQPYSSSGVPKVACMFYEKEDVFSMVADKSAYKGFKVGDVKVLNLVNNTTITGNVETVNIKGDLTVKMKDFTGKVADVDGSNYVEVSGFTGVITNDSTAVDAPTFYLTGWVAGTLVSYSSEEILGPVEFTEKGQYVTFGKNLVIPATPTSGDDAVPSVTYTRYVNDNYTLVIAAGMKSGSNGVTVRAGDNGLEVSGTITLADDATAAGMTFEGAAKVSGVIKANGKPITIAGGDYQITLEELRVDNGGAGDNAVQLTGNIVVKKQVTVNGDATFTGRMIIAPESNLNVTGTLTAKNIKEAVEQTPAETSKMFIGKNSTLRAKVVFVGSDSYAYDEDWTKVAFVDSTGSIYLNQNKVAEVSPVVVAYLNQIGAGTVSISSADYSTASTYFIYNQVVPYLSMNPVDVVCTSTIADEASIALAGVEYDGGELPIGNQARYVIDYTTGAPVFTVVFTELYKVAIKDAYDENGKQLIAVIDENGEEVDMVKEKRTEAVDPEDPESESEDVYYGIVELAYLGDYTIKGINEANKYKFSHDEPLPEDNEIEFERESNYAQSFTMIRAYLYTEADETAAMEGAVAGEYNEPVITYTVGYAVEITVNLADVKKNVSEGEVFMYYATSETTNVEPEDLVAVPVVLGEKQKAVITGVYTNDYIYLKSDYIKFYKFDVVYVQGEGGIDFGMDAIKVPMIALDTDSWTSGYHIVGNAPASEGKPYTAVFTVECVLDEVDVTFSFVGHEDISSDVLITVDFTTYCKDAKHTESVTVTTTQNTTIPVCVGEVYTITWEEVDKYLSRMIESSSVVVEPVQVTEGNTITVVQGENGTISASQEKAAAETVITVGYVPAAGYKMKSITVTGDESEETIDATSGSFVMPDEAVTVTAEFEKAPAYTKDTKVEVKKAVNYSLNFEEEDLMTFENATDVNVLTFTVGSYSIDVEKGKTGELIVNEGANADADGASVFAASAPLQISIKGANISWFSYQFYNGQGEECEDVTPSEATTKNVKASDTVSKAATRTCYGDFVELFVESNAVDKIAITDIQYTMITYYVTVDADDHAAVTNFDYSGYYNKYMKAYVQPDLGFQVFGLEYTYIDENGNEVTEQATHKVSEIVGQEFYDYYMPAADILLRPIIAKPTYEVSFVDQDGELVDKVDVVPFSADPISIPAVFGYVATAATTDAEIEGDFVFDAESQTVTFEMPAAPVEIKVTYDMGGPYSDDMELFISKTTNGVKITIIANDDLPIQSGYITIDYWYVYEEDGIYGMEQVVLDPIEFATSGAGVIESTTISLAEEEFFGAIYYVSATFEPINGDAMKSDYIAYQMA